MKILIILLLCISCSHARIVEVYDIKNQQTLTKEDFIAKTNGSEISILGEFHNDDNIQGAQAQYIDLFTEFHQLKNNITIHWEFLNFNEQLKTDTEFEKFLNQDLSALEFITQTSGKHNHHYTPIIDVLKKHQGKINGVNLPRAIKRKIRNEGFGAVDPMFNPPHHYVGGDDYFKRFDAAMGGHAPADTVKKLFESQCLTDSTMAYHLSKKLTESQAHFLVAGSFHTDFYDGTVERLKKISSQDILLLKFISKSKVTSEEINEYQNPHKEYGDIADYLIITK